ncbi:hypothetical protein B0H11DRAFT_2427388 [Mycena galericulata]|nr:hypothetical protein B0H11DRAFT_2427388 [Mycena galericulata]
MTYAKVPRRSRRISRPPREWWRVEPSVGRVNDTAGVRGTQDAETDEVSVLPHGDQRADWMNEHELGVPRQISFAPTDFMPRTAANKEWAFQTVFREGNFLAAGKLTIGPYGTKPLTSARDNVYVFNVTEGSVRFEVHGYQSSSTDVDTDGAIMIPREHSYRIHNPSNRRATLWYTQARETKTENELGDEAPAF